MLKFPGAEEYYCHIPWVFKQMVDGLLAADLFIYMDDGRPIGPTKDLCWEASRSWVSTCYWLGIQESPRKVQPPSQAPGSWAINFTNTEGGVHGLVSKERRDNTWRLVEELVGMEREGRYGMYRARVESIRGFMLYVSSTYREMNTYLK